MSLPKEPGKNDEGLVTKLFTSAQTFPTPPKTKQKTKKNWRGEWGPDKVTETQHKCAEWLHSENFANLLLLSSFGSMLKKLNCRIF